jgi:Calcium/calmodulin dependent protein kinase II association domain
MADRDTSELLDLSQRLLECIVAGDWNTYQELCDPSLTAFEPEARGQLIEGLTFHRFYFDRGGIKGSPQTTMVSPRVRILGNVAVVAYVRLTQRTGTDGKMETVVCEESRVWQRVEGKWRHVHFHRSVPS